MEKIINDCELLIKNSQNEMARIKGDCQDLILGYNPFHHASIYQIVSENADLCYVGSTNVSIEQRLRRHEYDYKNYKENGKGHYITSYDIIEAGDYKIELIENVCCENERELQIIEGLWQRKTNNRVNKIIVGRTPKEWREDNKIVIKYKKRIYREENKNEMKEKDKLKYEKNK